MTRRSILPGDGKHLILQLAALLEEGAMPRKDRMRSLHVSAANETFQSGIFS